MHPQPKSFLGFVPNDDLGSVSVGILNLESNAAMSSDFAMPDGNKPVTLEFLGYGDRPTEFDALGDFLTAHASAADDCQVVVQLMSCTQSSCSNVVKLLLYLSSKGYCISSIGHDDTGERLFVQRVPEFMRPQEGESREAFYLPGPVSQCYRLLFCDDYPVIKSDGLAAAAIASNRHLYDFFWWQGVAQSSQDIVVHLRIGCPSGVVSGNGFIGLSTASTTRFDGIDDLPLEYELAKKKYGYLGEKMALKFAVLTVCRSWRIPLRFVSADNESVDRNTPMEEFHHSEKYLIHTPERPCVALPQDRSATGV